MYLTDFHTHSRCSQDAHDTMADMAAAARDRGTNSSMERLPITTPAAWMEVCLGSPSRRLAMSMR